MAAREKWLDLIEKIQARATGLRTAARGCSDDGYDRFALLARADEDVRILEIIEAAIEDVEEVVR